MESFHNAIAQIRDLLANFKRLPPDFQKSTKRPLGELESYLDEFRKQEDRAAQRRQIACKKRQQEYGKRKIRPDKKWI